MSQPAHLEISHRMSGKTHRLLEAARKLTAAGRKVVFVTPLAGHLPAIAGGTFVRDPNHASVRDRDDDTWIYDEFDFLKGVKVRAGAYYATTPRFLRVRDADASTDTLLALIKANDGLFLSGGLVHLEMREHMRREMSPDQFRMQMLGEFIA